LTAIEVAKDHWQQHDGREDLGAVLDAAIGHLGHAFDGWPGPTGVRAPGWCRLDCQAAARAVAARPEVADGNVRCCCSCAPDALRARHCMSRDIGDT